MRKARGALLFAFLTAAVGLAQRQGGYLDLYVARVKPEKRTEFDAINKKMADANRRHKGETWLAYETVASCRNSVTLWQRL